MDSPFASQPWHAGVRACVRDAEEVNASSFQRVPVTNQLMLAQYFRSTHPHHPTIWIVEQEEEESTSAS
jgi:hypothetical protein